MLDRRFAALSDPTRRAMLDRLACSPASLSGLAEPFDMTLPAVLKHVRVLEAAELVVTSKVGRARMCELAANPLADVSGWVEQRRRRWGRLLDRFAEHIADRGDGS